MALTRAQFARFSLVAGASALVGPAAWAQPAEKDGADFGAYVMVAADPHYLSPRLTDRGAFFEALVNASDGKVMWYSDELLEAFVQVVLAERPSVLVLPGDLTFNGALQSHEDLAAKLARVVDAGIPVLVIPGNHDVYCDAAARFEGDAYELVPSASAEDFARIWGAFGYDAARSRDEASLSYVWEYSPELRFLCVDVNAVEEPGTVPAATLAWIEAELAAACAAGAHVVSVSHQSLLQHTFVSEGYVVNNALELLELYARYGVGANLCGHLHVQHVMREESGFAEMATSALCVAPVQFARVLLAPNGGAGCTDDAPGTIVRDPLRLRYATAPLGDAVSAWAAALGSDDPNLLDFAAYARAFFDGGDDRRNAMILELAFAGFAEAVEMVDFVLAVNRAYFSGRIDLVEPQPELVARWREADLVIGYYLTYVCELVPARDHNVLEVELR